MTTGIKTIGITFSVAIPTEVTGTPKRQNFVNTLDLLGDGILSTKRLENESNAEYKQRLMDIRVHPGSPIYEGVINNLTREFGYSREHAFTISLINGSSGNPLASNPRVDLLANRVVLYSDWRPNGTAVVDKEIYIYNTDSTGYFLEDLIAEINTSSCFSAAIESGIRSNIHSTNLILTTSDRYIERDLIDSDIQTKLSAELIIQDSLTFSDQTIFSTEVSSEPATSGEYKIDYINGKVFLSTTPYGKEEISYHYANFPLEIDYSPIKVYSLQDDNFVNQLFITETNTAGEEQKTLPNTEGSEIYHQLFKDAPPTFWGK